jgi:hypothetical protein
VVVVAPLTGAQRVHIRSLVRAYKRDAIAIGAYERVASLRERAAHAYAHKQVCLVPLKGMYQLKGSGGVCPRQPHFIVHGT